MPSQSYNVLHAQAREIIENEGFALLGHADFGPPSSLVFSRGSNDCGIDTFLLIAAKSRLGRFGLSLHVEAKDGQERFVSLFNLLQPMIRDADRIAKFDLRVMSKFGFSMNDDLVSAIGLPYLNLATPSMQELSALGYVVSKLVEEKADQFPTISDLYTAALSRNDRCFRWLSPATAVLACRLAVAGVVADVELSDFQTHIREKSNQIRADLIDGSDAGFERFVSRLSDWYANED